MAIIRNLEGRVEELSNPEYSTEFRFVAHPSKRLDIAFIAARKQAGQEPKFFLYTKPNKIYNPLPLQEITSYAQKNSFSEEELTSHVLDTLNKQEKHLELFAADARKATYEEQHPLTETLFDQLTERLVAYRLLAQTSNSDIRDKGLQGAIHTYQTINLLKNESQKSLLHHPTKPYVQILKTA